MTSPLSGLRIIEDENMVDRLEDWSRVRSPSRARRRMKRGHRQNVDVRFVPQKHAYMIGSHTVVMHPVTATELRQMSRAAGITS